MGRKLTTEEFIEKARKKHGDKYDYSEVEYVDAKTKIRIFCPEHGPFLQNPRKHLSGQGCSQCSHKAKTLTNEEFIKRAREVHGDKYDYSQTKYVNSYTQVYIICPEHGGFCQLPHNHLTSQGCPECTIVNKSIKYRQPLIIFLSKAIEKHGNKYDYSKVEYKNNHTKVCIICPEHGPFLQEPSSHLQGCGCPTCVGLAPLNTETFVKRAREIHGDKYDYSETVYVNDRTKLRIICPIHEPFYQTPNKHLSCKHGCPFCKSSKMELVVKKLLKNNNIQFKYNCFDFEWLRHKQRLQLDFYLLDYNVAIECQGRQHFEAVERFGGEESLKYIQNNDRIKQQLCEAHGIKLFYIKYDDNVEEKMNEIVIIIQSQL